MGTPALSEHHRLRHRGNALAVVASVLLALATFNLLMALGGGLGLWNFAVFAPGGMHDVGVGLALWAIAAWTVAGFVSGFVVVTVSRSFVRHDAYIYGSIAWAATCLTGLVLAWTWLICAVASGLASRDMVGSIKGGIMLVFFVANLAAFTSTLVGAGLGARRQARLLVASYRADASAP